VEGKCQFTCMSRELLTDTHCMYFTHTHTHTHSRKHTWSVARYTTKSEGIIYIRRHSTTDVELQWFQVLEAEVQKCTWKASVEWLAEQLIYRRIGAAGWNVITHANQISHRSGNNVCTVQGHPSLRAGWCSGHQTPMTDRAVKPMGRRQNLITVTSFDESCDSTMVLRRVYDQWRKNKDWGYKVWKCIIKKEEVTFLNLKWFHCWRLNGQEEVEYYPSCDDTQEGEQGGEGEPPMAPGLAVQVCCSCQLCLELLY